MKKSTKIELSVMGVLAIAAAGYLISKKINDKMLENTDITENSEENSFTENSLFENLENDLQNY